MSAGLLLVVSVAACGDGGEDGGGGEDAVGGEATVEIVGFEYQPEKLEVDSGMTVTWVNRDVFGHTVTSGEPGELSGKFDGVLGERADGKGKRFTFTFQEAGTVPYFCRFHPNMRGELELKA